MVNSFEGLPKKMEHNQEGIQRKQHQPLIMKSYSLAPGILDNEVTMTNLSQATFIDDYHPMHAKNCLSDPHKMSKENLRATTNSTHTSLPVNPDSHPNTNFLKLRTPKKLMRADSQNHQKDQPSLPTERLEQRADNGRTRQQPTRLCPSTAASSSTTLEPV